MKEFNEVKKRFGFGCMRLPMIGEEVDKEQFKQMVDLFIESGFNYFDTAHGYIYGKSELAIKECLTSRYPRDKYVLTDKLTENFFNSEEDIERVFDDQLQACGVDYFDFYLMHAQNRNNFLHFKKHHAYEHALEFLKQGRIRHLGISFHDTAEILDQILTEYPQIEVVQIQYNYLDYDNDNIQSKLCYEVCVKHDKRVIVMEPIRGGGLINLPQKPAQMLKNKGISPANLALRFAASPKNMFMVLSGMSNLDQMKDNVSFMGDFKPLSEEEFKFSQEVAHVIRDERMVACTSCKYCVEGCPMNIFIPELFTSLNLKMQLEIWKAQKYYRDNAIKDHGLASQCIKCGQCERVCPQHLPIRDLLEIVAKEFE